MRKEDFKNVISENIRKVDIIKDFWNICKKCRESYYYLNSLNRLLNDEFVLKSDEKEGNTVKNIKNEIIKFGKRIFIAEKSFEKLEYKLSHKSDNIPKNNQIASDEAAATIVEIDTNNLFNILIEYIKLNEKIDKLQLDILNLIIKNRDEVNKAIINKNKKLNMIYTQYMENNLLNMTFNHSSDEDKIDTYELSTTDNTTRKDLKDIKIDLPYRIRVRDYAYLINDRRELCKNYSMLTLKLLEIDEKNREEEELKKLNRKQYYFNIVVTIFTIISSICGIWSLIYSIKDHIK